MPIIPNSAKKAVKNVVNKVTGKKEAPTLNEQKSQVEQTRARAKQIVSLLAKIRFDRETSAFDQETMDRYRDDVAALSYCLYNANIIRLDVQEIDKELVFFATVLDAAIRSGCRESADRALQALNFGILIARKDLLPGANEEEALESRMNRLQLYHANLELSRKNDEIHDMLRRQKAKRERDQTAFDCKQSEFETFRAENPAAYQMVENFGIQSETLSGAARELVGLMKEATNLYNALKETDALISHNSNLLIDNRNMITQNEIVMTQEQVSLNDKLLESMHKQQELFKQELLKQQEMSRKLEDLSENFTRMIESIFDDVEERDRIYNTLRRYETMQRELEEERRLEAEGRKLLLIQQQEQEAQQHEQEPQQILINN